MAKERTLVLIKPDSVQRGLAGRIIARFEERGFQLAGARHLQMDADLAARLYEPHVGKGFYPPLVEYMTCGPIVALCVEGYGVIDAVRKMMGATDAAKAEPGTIRGDFGQRIDRNCVHGSDSLESAMREIPIFFSEKDLVDYTATFTQWV